MSRPKIKAFPCPDCGKGFTSDWAMDEHRTIKHGTVRSIFKPVDPSRYPCPVCHTAQRSALGLDKHMAAVHSDAKPPVGRRPQVTEVDVTCLECGGEGKLVGGKDIYPHRPDLYSKHFYRCACGAYCGCHPNSIVPLGHPCGPETRKARSAAHSAFDPLWKHGGPMSRASAYKWLAGQLGIDPAYCHIGMMSAETARATIEAAKSYRGELV